MERFLLSSAQVAVVGTAVQRASNSYSPDYEHRHRGSIQVGDGTVIGQEIFVAKVFGTDTNEVTPADTLGAYAVADIAAVGDNVFFVGQVPLRHLFRQVVVEPVQVSSSTGVAVGLNYTLVGGLVTPHYS